MPAAAKVRIFQASYVTLNSELKSEVWVSFLPITVTNTGCFHVFQQSLVLDHLIVALMVLNMLHFYMIRYNLSCVGRNHNQWSVDYVPPGHYFTTLLLLIASLMQPWVLRCSHTILIPQTSPHVLAPEKYPLQEFQSESASAINNLMYVCPCIIIYALRRKSTRCY